MDANWYVGEYQEQHGKQISLALQYPSCSAYLIIHNKTITSNYCKHLINAYIKPMFLGYLQQKNEWEDNTIIDIVWKSLSLLAQWINKSVLLTKLCNNIPTTASTLQKWNYQDTDKCVSCYQHKNRNHLIWCNWTSRLVWHIKLIVVLRRTLIKLKTHWKLSDKLCSVLTEWMDKGYIDIKTFRKIFIHQ